MQELPTVAGDAYVLYFEAYSGPWSTNTGADMVKVHAADLDMLVEVGPEHRLEQDSDEGLALNCSVAPLKAEYEFQAKENTTALRFWGPQGNCIDITEVVVRSKFGVVYEGEDYNDKTEAQEEADAVADIKEHKAEEH